MLSTYKIRVYIFLYWLDIDSLSQKTAYCSKTTRHMETKSLITDRFRTNRLGTKQRFLPRVLGAFYLDQCFTNSVCVSQVDNKFSPEMNNFLVKYIGENDAQCDLQRKWST